MSLLTARDNTVANGRDAADAIRSKVVQFRASALPRVASATEHAGDAVSKIALSTSKKALSTSKSVAGALRKRAPSGVEKFVAVLPISPLARGAARFALRNPVLLAAAGLGIAALGYAAWRRQQAETDLTVDNGEFGEVE